MVLATFDEENRTAGASLLAILGGRSTTAGTGSEAGSATLLFVPAGTLADIPGHGLERIGRSLAFGGPALLDATLDNLLGVDFDSVATISEQGWASAFSRVGGLTLTLEERLIATTDGGGRRVRFQPGEQHLDGPRLAELLTFQQPGEGGLARLSRAKTVLVGMLDSIAADPRTLEDMFAGASVFDGPVRDRRVRALLADAAEAAAAGRLDVLTLPVSPIGSGPERALRLDEERADQLVGEHFAGSVPAGTSEGRRLQILNGNGQPGIGQTVAQELVPAGFRVVITDNADHFDHERTKIIVHSDDETQLARAREIRDHLDVGEVVVSRTPQSVVDITLVVGDDYRAESEAGAGSGGSPAAGPSP